MILQLVPSCLSFNPSTLIQAFPDIFPSWQSRCLDSLEFLGALFPQRLYIFLLLSTLLVVRLFLCLELILKSIRELSLHLSLFIYEILIAELPTLCLDKLPFFFFFFFPRITFIFKASLVQSSVLSTSAGQGCRFHSLVG